MKRLFLIGMIFMFALVACGGGEVEVAEITETAVPEPTATDQPVVSTETAVPEPTATTEPTNTPEPIVAAETGSSDETTETASEDDTNSEEAAESTVGGDANCIIGTWRISNFSEYLVESMLASVPADANMAIEAETSGDLFLTFTESDMSMTDDDFVVTVTMAGQTIPVAVEANGTATYSTDGATISNIVTAYDSTGTSGETAVSIDLGTLTAAGANGGTVTYTCAGNNMAWTAPFATPIQFVRTGS